MYLMRQRRKCIRKKVRMNHVISNELQTESVLKNILKCRKKWFTTLTEYRNRTNDETQINWNKKTRITVKEMSGLLGRTDKHKARFLHTLMMKTRTSGKTDRLISLIRHGPHRKRLVQQVLYCCVCIRCRGNVIRGRCLVTIGGYRYRHRDWWEGFMKYAVEMDSGAMIYIPSVIEIGSGIQKLMGGGGSQIHR
jgi:hypothetical protein